MSKTVQKSRAPKKVAVFFIVFIILEMLVVGGIAYIFRNDDVTPSVLGYSAFIMDSDNMSNEDPTKGYPKDALVIAEESTPGKNNIGEAVLCENVPGIGSTVMWLADVEASANVDGVVCVVSQNDEKEYKLKSTNIIGTVHNYYKIAGKVIKFISKPMGIAACAAVPLVLWFVIEIIVIAATSKSRKKRRSDSDDYDDEDEDQITLDDILYGKDDARPLKFDGTDEEDDIEDDQQDEYTESDAMDAAADSEISTDSDEVDISFSNADDEAVNADEGEAEKAAAVHYANVDESVSTTRKAATDSLEELMKMMEEEQKKLNEQLKK